MLQSATLAVKIFRGGAVLHDKALSTVVEQSLVEAGANGFLSANLPYDLLVEEDFKEMHGASIRVRVSVDYKTRFGDVDRIQYETTKSIVSSRPINPEIQIIFRDNPLVPSSVTVERIQKSKAHYEEE